MAIMKVLGEDTREDCIGVLLQQVAYEGELRRDRLTEKRAVSKNRVKQCATDGIFVNPLSKRGIGRVSGIGRRVNPSFESEFGRVSIGGTRHPSWIDFPFGQQCAQPIGFRERIVREIGKAFSRAAKKVRNTSGTCGKLKIEGRLDYEAFCLPRDNGSVTAAAAAIEAEGAEVDYAVANGGLDANWLTERGISTVSLGCGQNKIHTVDEWLDLVEFHRARRIALRLATEE